MTHFLSLNEYALRCILAYLTEIDLVNLAMCSLYLQDIVNDFLKAKIRQKLMVCNQSRSLPVLTPINLLRVNRNWLEGRYLERISLRHKPLYFCHIQLNRNELLKSHGDELRAYKRDTKGYLSDKPFMMISTQQQADFTHFRMREGKIFAGLSNGTCIHYDIDEKVMSTERLFRDCEFINCVDFIDDIYVTLGKRHAKIFRMETELGISALEEKFEFPYIFQTCRLHTSKQTLAAGKYSDRNKRALCMIDVETGIVEEMESVTGAIYDMLWKDENVVITANFDSTLRFTDTRTKRDELMFRDIYDSSIYCVDFDGKYGFVCGMKYFRVNLYDIRVPKRFTQMYFPKRTSFNSSPVYSIQCDASQLFIQTDTNLRILDFNSGYSKQRDYSNMNVY